MAVHNLAPELPAPEDDPFGPYLTLERRHWAALAAARPDLEAETLARLRGVNEPMDVDEVGEIYLPLTELIQLYSDRTAALYRDSHRFLGLSGARTPFVIGVAGSVAVGKSTTSRLLKELLSRGPGNPKVDLVTIDDVFGGWKKAQPTHFGDGGTFDQLYKPAR